MSSVCDVSAARLRTIMSSGEGEQMDRDLYAYATQSASAATLAQAANWKSILAQFHANKVDDQFIPPLVLVERAATATDGDAVKAVGRVREGDIVVYFDYRTDRAKPLTAAFLNIPYGGQVGGLSAAAAAKRPQNVRFVTMTNYDDAFLKTPNLGVAYNPAAPLSETYAEVCGLAGVSQLVCAESEKWRAVTWFKDGRRNLGYKRVSSDGIVLTEKHTTLPITVRIVESRKVSAHIEAPQMRAAEIADLLEQGVRDGIHDIFANFANADMVAHAMTDKARFGAVVEGVLALDAALERVVATALKAGYVVFVTGDHGNAEEMFTKDGKANPSHTTNKVPLCVLGLDADERVALSLRADATIASLGPSALHLRGLKAPGVWDCESALLGGALRTSPQRRIMRLILDGYGVRDERDGNAMAAAADRKGALLAVDRWLAGGDGAISVRAEASGERCGYPAGEAGTTEFGHVLFDAGRSVQSDATIIDHAVRTGKFASNDALLAAAAAVARGCDEHAPRLHITGIVSDGKVHSSLEHLDALLKLLAGAGVPGDRVFIHVITDGRDVAGDSSPRYIDWLEAALARHKIGRIVTISGRAWGKDRDNRWLRIEAAFRSLVEGTGALHVSFN